MSTPLATYDEAALDGIAATLYQALRTGTPIEPLTTTHPDLTLDLAYRVSKRLLRRRLADGETVVGAKIGVTSKPVQDMLGVDQPDFGWLTDAMVFDNGATIDLSNWILPRAEGELAFRLGSDLAGPGVTASDVLAATEAVIPCFEVVDSRIADWRIKIEDTVADNASCGVLVLGDSEVDPRGLDLSVVGMVIDKNGELLSTGAGAAALGSPLNCLVWLANTLGRLGEKLEAGSIILSGSLVPLEPVAPGDRMSLQVAGLGAAEVSFA